MTAHFHHAAGRHHKESTVAAVLSHVLVPERTLLNWTYGRPEAVILPAIAVFFALGELWAAAAVLGAAGLVLAGVLAVRDAHRRVQRALFDVLGATSPADGDAGVLPPVGDSTEDGAL